MRTIMEIDGCLITEAMRLSGLRTKGAVVDEALRCFIQSKRLQSKRQLEAIEDMWGLGWEGDLDAMRREW